MLINEEHLKSINVAQLNFQATTRLVGAVEKMKTAVAANEKSNKRLLKRVVNLRRKLAEERIEKKKLRSDLQEMKSLIETELLPWMKTASEKIGVDAPVLSLGKRRPTMIDSSCEPMNESLCTDYAKKTSSARRRDECIGK
jgi:hypothetical protein